MSTRSGFAPVLFVLTFTAAVPPGTASAQSEERSVYASVLDEAGAPVTNLAAVDFLVREDGEYREVVRVSPATEPLRIAVLVDTSQAMDRHVNDLRMALRRFFKEMEGGHQFAVIAFGERPTILTDYTSNPAILEEGVGRLFAQPGSGAYVLDAIVDVSRGLRRREGPRPVIVVITTEGPEFSQRYHQTVLDELRTDAALHAFVLTRPGASFATDAAREREYTLAKGARMTGGRREDLLTSMALSPRLYDLTSELKNQYHVVYARPGALIPPETLDVDVTRPGLNVRAPRVPTKPRTTS